jgi:hypothetical protein
MISAALRTKLFICVVRVDREVNCCLSSLVSTLASGAFELACPVADHEEAALQAGWRKATEKEVAFGFDAFQHKDGAQADVRGWIDLCEANDIEPHDREVCEHWSVSTWFAEKLIEQGEKVDTDFAGMNVWARTTTGQGIMSDGVIERIYAAMVKS